MKRSHMIRSILALVLCAVMLLSGTAATRAANSTNNRFNVVILMDASGSLRSTDPDGLRFDAVRSFVELLAEQGHYLGGVVFHTNIPAEIEPSLIKTAEDKQKVIEVMESIKTSNQFTNLGAGLDRAVEMLKTKGDPNLPSVILFLSDGNTEMQDDEKTNISLNLKGDALQKARAAGVQIFSVCLNANNKADISEMQQLSDSTGGVFIEVKSAKDLQDAFDKFYNLIFGTTTTTIEDTVFPTDGELRTNFTVPGLGVEEVNIVIYGKTTGQSLEDINGGPCPMVLKEAADLTTCTMLKITDVVPGEWVLITRGVPGNSVKINMVYNPNIEVDVTTDPAATVIASPQNPVTVTAKLRDGQKVGSEPSHYTGFQAKLQVMNAKLEVLDTFDMDMVGDRFELSQVYPEGNYFFKVLISGNYINKESKPVGPINLSSKVPPYTNTAPYPVEPEVTTTLHMFPWSGKQPFTLDMSGLAKDDEQTELEYEIISTSFLPGDYTQNGNLLEVPVVKVGGGAFTVRAIDDWGLDCTIEVVVKTVNWTFWGSVALIVCCLIAVLIIGLILFRKSITPFRGTIEVTVTSGGVPTTGTMKPRAGRCKLALFRVPNIGLNPQKTYFQATGKSYIFLQSDKKAIYYNGQQVKQVRIPSGATVTVRVVGNDNATMNIRFESLVKDRGPKVPHNNRPPVGPGPNRPAGPGPNRPVAPGGRTGGGMFGRGGKSGPTGPSGRTGGYGGVRGGPKR